MDPITELKYVFGNTAKDGTEIPYGHCQCGCGQRTAIAQADNIRWGYVRGEPFPFTYRHRGKGCDRDPNKKPVYHETGENEPMGPIAELEFILNEARRADIGQRYYLSCLSPNGSGWPLRISFAGGAAGECIGDLAIIHKPEPWAVSEVNCDGLQLCWESDFHFADVWGRRLMIRGDGYRRTWDRPLYRAWLNAWEQVLDLGHVAHNGKLGFNIGTEGMCLHGYYLAPIGIVFKNQHSAPNYRRLMLVNAAAQAAPGSWSLEKLPLRWSALRKIEIKLKKEVLR